MLKSNFGKVAFLLLMLWGLKNHKIYFSSLVFAFFTSLPVNTISDLPTTPDASTPITTQMPLKSNPPRSIRMLPIHYETVRRDLFGIGFAKARAIVAYRDSNGPFTGVDELPEMKGIGKVLLERNRGRLVIN